MLEDYNTTMHIVYDSVVLTIEYAVLKLLILLLQVYHTHNLEISTSSYLLHSVHHTFPSGQQKIDCVIATVQHKSNLTDDLHFPESFAFISILEWHSFVCGKFLFNLSCLYFCDMPTCTKY